MKQTNWRDIAELIGIGAIVASLVFVAIQIRQSNQIGRLEAMQSMASDWATVGLELAGNERLAVLLAKADGGALRKDFDAVENRQLFSVLHGLDHHWEMRFNQLNLGVLEMRDYSFPGPPRTSIFASAYHKEIWPGIRPGLSEEFAVFWEQRFGLVDQ
ncbi:MAG: hypothetical protein OEV34_18415 [Gammaproteobacteria bacterium]|nr:hypothetical protein [Gammaproteobacteria bacterium]